MFDEGNKSFIWISFFLNGQAFTPPPLNGTAISGGFFFAASLIHSFNAHKFYILRSLQKSARFFRELGNIHFILFVHFSIKKSLSAFKYKRKWNISYKKLPYKLLIIC